MGIMGTLSHHVYKIETQTSQYTSIGASLSLKVFKQSCWFVIAFYITWVQYLTLQVSELQKAFCALRTLYSFWNCFEILVLQYMFSSGQGYDNYGLILSAATLAPLQGFWNAFVYIRPRYLSSIVARVGSPFRCVSSFFQRKSKADAT